MLRQDIDVWGRLSALMEAYGILGVSVLIILGLVCINYMLLRGAGLTFLILMVSYGLSFLSLGGMGTGVFFIRVLCLIVLVISSLKNFSIPGWPFVAMLGYVLLGMLFMPLSLNVMWSFQLSMLLLVTFLGCTLGGASYFSSRESIIRFFQCCVVGGLVWSLYSFMHVGDFLSGRGVRFTGGEDVNAVQYSMIGALFIPFMVWAVIQSEKRIWRLAGLAGLFTMPIWIFLSGTRQGVVIAVLASAPLLVRKGALRTVGMWLVFVFLALGVLFVAAVLLGGYDTGYLIERFTRQDFGHRGIRWATGLQACLERPIIGRGHGGESTLTSYLGVSFHNSYLAIWVNTGIVGLLCVVSVLIGQSINAYLMVRRAADPFIKDAAKLALGVMLAMAARAQVEVSLAGPSGLFIAMLLLISTLITRLQVLENQNTIAWLSTGALLPDDTLAIPMRYGLPGRRARTGQAN